MSTPTPILALLPTSGFVAINLAYIGLLAAAFCRSMIPMRILLVLAALFFIGFGVIEGITSMVVWNAVIGGLNGKRLIDDIAERVRTVLTADQARLHRELFPELTPREFLRLWRLGTEALHDDGHCVTEAAAGRLHLVVSGAIRLDQTGSIHRPFGAGSFISDPPPSAGGEPPVGWRADGACRIRSWEPDDLAGDAVCVPARMLTGRSPAPQHGEPVR